MFYQTNPRERRHFAGVWRLDRETRRQDAGAPGPALAQ